MIKKFKVTNRSSFFFNEIGTISKQQYFVPFESRRGIVLDFKFDSGETHHALWFSNDELEEVTDER